MYYVGSIVFIFLAILMIVVFVKKWRERSG